MDDNTSQKLIEDALIKWRIIQTRKRESVSLNGFAAYLNVSCPMVSFWLNGKRTVTVKQKIKIAPKLADLLGDRVYSTFNVLPPDPELKRIMDAWADLSLGERKKLAEKAEQIALKV